MMAIREERVSASDRKDAPCSPRSRATPVDSLLKAHSPLQREGHLTSHPCEFHSGLNCCDASDCRVPDSRPPAAIPFVVRMQFRRIIRATPLEPEGRDPINSLSAI